MERRQAEVFRDLQRGAFIGLGPAISRRPLRVSIGAVETGDRGGAPKLLPLPEAHGAEALQSLIFAPGEAAPPARPRAKPERVQEIFARIAAPPADILAAPPPDLTEAEREAAMEEIIGQIVGADNAAQQAAETLHRDFQLRCRIRRLGPATPDLADFRRRLTIFRARRAFPDGADEEAWGRAVDLAARLAGDMQSVFLYLSRAAVAGQPCPDDEDIANFFGSASPSRARRMLGQLEQSELIVARVDFEQRRIVAFPELGLETAA
jgi:hypothetical protein